MRWVAMLPIQISHAGVKRKPLWRICTCIQRQGVGLISMEDETVEVVGKRQALAVCTVMVNHSCKHSHYHVNRKACCLNQGLANA